MVTPAVDGIDLFKIAGRSISGWVPSFKRLLFLPTVYLARVTTLCQGLWPKCLLLIESEILRLRLRVSPEVVSFYMSTESKWPETLYVSSATAFASWYISLASDQSVRMSTVKPCIVCTIFSRSRLKRLSEDSSSRT